MKLFRFSKLGLGLLGSLLGSLLAASVASAVDVNMTISETSGAGTISGDGLTISGVTAGDTITVLIEVDNTPGPDAIQSLFSTVTFDPLVVDVTGGGSLGTVLQEEGFGGASLGVIAQPQQKFGEPDGNYIGLAFASTGDPTEAPGPEVTTQLIFTAQADGTTDITGLLGSGDESIINGVANSPGSSPDLFFSDAIMVTVPEPATMVLSGFALMTTLGVAGIRRRFN